MEEGKKETRNRKCGFLKVFSCAVWPGKNPERDVCFKTRRGGRGILLTSKSNLGHTHTCRKEKEAGHF